MLNLYIINETRRGAVYGVGTYIRELTVVLKDSNIKVYVVHLKSDKNEEEAEEMEDICHLHFPPPITQNILFDWNKQSELYYRNVVYLLRLQIKDTENLVFHLNFNNNDKIAEELKKAFNCKVVAVVHYSEWGLIVYDNLPRLRSILKDESPDDFGRNLKKTFEEEQSFYSKADRVICLSNYMHDILCQDYKLEATKISVIPNGLTDTTKTKADINLLREKWKLSPEEKILLFAGRIADSKGLGFLIKAFRNVLNEYPQSRLVIAGDGDFSKYTKETQDICTRITYAGLLTKAQLYEWYCIADVGVSPSLFETFGYIAIEMMMHELPIVATATSGLNEVVDDTCGLKVPIMAYPDRVEIDTDLLAEKILYLLQHPAEAKEMGQNGRRRYLKEYSSEIFRSNMLKLYNL